MSQRNENAPEDLFLAALAHLRAGRTKAGKELIRQVLSADPRLPEPYLELAIVLRDEDDLENALETARLGLELLEKGGQWLDEVPPDVLLAHAHNLLGELLVEAAQEGETPFDLPRFAALWNEAVRHFEAARRLDPESEAARTNAIMHRPVEAGGAEDEKKEE